MTLDEAEALMPGFARAINESPSSDEACRLVIDAIFQTISRQLGHSTAMSLFLNYLAEQHTAPFKDD